MTIEIRHAMPNALLLIMDYQSGIPPEKISTSLVFQTATCIALCTMPGNDGLTLIRVSRVSSNSIIEKDLHKAYQGELELTSRSMSLVDTSNVELVRVHTTTNLIEVSIWVDNDDEPTSVHIVYQDKSG
jgi:hypothetical protein